MDSLNLDYVKKRKIYRDVFEKASAAITQQLTELRKYYSCFDCASKCNSVSDDVLSKYPKHCKYRAWQEACLYKLNNEISKDIYIKIKEILDRRKDYSCNNCAVCCNFACSEFSHSELLLKAENGDNFAKQFTAVFIPYEEKIEAMKIYPQYVNLLSEQYQNLNDVYFYHCPKLKNNLCSDYENRPVICRDFPDNPLAILPKSCGFYDWREDVEISAMLMHALSEIAGYYIDKISEALKSPD